MNRLICFGLFLLFALGTQVHGQELTITGTVTDASDGSTLPGVTVAVRGTTQGTVTDIDGRYQIRTSSDAVLVFSFIGMATQEVPVQGRNIINVALESEIRALGEVVVVGYGTARPVGTVVGSLTTVSAEQIERRPVANVWDAMQGRVAGLQVFTSSGEPSQVSSMRLHGVGSLGASSTPLYVLDGAPVAPGNILSLNPNDIESVTVLKDASATSIYGARAANGVIFITTKRGHRDERAIITVNTQYGVSSLANEDYFNRFMNTDQLTNFWIETGYRTEQQVADILETYPHDTRWHRYFYQETAPTYMADISIRGGGGRTTYYVSGAYFQQEGLATFSDFERYSLRANINSFANDWFSFGANLALSNDFRQTNPFARNFIEGGLSSLIPPFYSPYDEDGNPVDGLMPGTGRYDPYYRERMFPREGDNIQGNLVGYMQLNPMEGLTIRTQAGLDGYDYRYFSQRLPSFIGNLGNGSALEYFSRNITRNITNTAEYRFNVGGRHEFTVLGGQEYLENTFERFEASSEGHNDDRLMLLTAGPENRNLDHFKSEYAYSSFFGRFDYSLDRKYFIDFSVRQDESSRFGRENRTATFYATGLMWDIGRESFMEDFDFISGMRLRASIGTSGNSEIGNYGHLATVGTTQYGGASGWLIATPGNPILAWEKQTKFTVGTNVSLFNDRYNMNIEYYIRETSNQLISVPQPYTSGFANITENVGSLRNSGIDIELSMDVLRERDYFLTPYVNFNYNSNEVTELFHGLDYWIIPNTGVAWVVGSPVAFYYPIFAGIDPDDGMPMWYVPGEDRTVTTKEETTKVFNTSDLEQNTGTDRYPPFAGGFGFNAGWRGFTVQADFAVVLGKYMINNDRFFTENPSNFAGWNQHESVLDYWKEPGDQTQFPRWGEQFTQFDSRLVEDASFLRMKNLSIAYNLPQSIMQRAGFVTGTRIFLSGRNLLTWTNYLGPDPEVDSNIGMGTNPNTKQVTLGLTLTF
ncbi:MAG: SusC/RagA family TonB-linked outer membrane protein [Bacteroidia bacterium]|nr:MAG: SusC/RagA family TonB-linked outer membrane protein [Bacteroidia bacterium]